MRINQVGIVGAGALGLLLGERLVKTLGPEGVQFIADESRCRRYEQTGFQVNGQALRIPCVSAPRGKYLDLILFAVKSYDLPSALELVRPFVGPETILMSLLNGISSEEIIGEALGAEKVLYTVGQGMDATRVGQTLNYTVPGFWRLGEADGTESERLQAVVALYDQAGIAFEVCPDIRYQLWSKLMLNTGVNQTLAVLGGSYRVIHENQNDSRQIMRQAMEEVRKLAALEGVTIPEAEIDVWFRIVDSLGPDQQPSMLQDVEAGRQTEVELFAGTIRRLGARHGVATPINDWFYEEILKKSPPHSEGFGSRGLTD